MKTTEKLPRAKNTRNALHRLETVIARNAVTKQSSGTAGSSDGLDCFVGLRPSRNDEGGRMASLNSVIARNAVTKQSSDTAGSSGVLDCFVGLRPSRNDEGGRTASLNSVIARSVATKQSSSAPRSRHIRIATAAARPFDETQDRSRADGLVMRHSPRTGVQGLLSLFTVAAASLLMMMAPQRAHAAPCAGTTLTPSPPVRTATVSCDGATTILDVTGALGSLTGVPPATVLSGSGSGPVVINNAGGATYGSVTGGLNFSGSNGGVTFNNAAGSGGWVFQGDQNAFGAGADIINNAGLISTASGGNLGGQANVHTLHEATVNFGDGQDVFNNTGTLIVGGTPFSFGQATTGVDDSFLGKYHVQPSFMMASTTTFKNLETFNNSGLIVMGGSYYLGGTTGLPLNDPAYAAIGPRFYSSGATGEAYCRSVLKGRGASNDPPDGYLCTDSLALDDTNRQTNDVLSMPGTTFTGSGNSTILMDAMFGKGLAQVDCDHRGDADDFHRLPGADCVDLSGGATAGSTQIIIRDAVPTDQGSYNPEGITIIDVSGGTSAATDFTLSPLSDHYATTANGIGVIDKGLFVFPLIYDAATQQHKLVGLPGAAAYRMPLLPQAAQDMARRETASGIDHRQDALRASLRDGTPVKGGFWADVDRESISRDSQSSVSAYGERLDFDNDFDQNLTTMTLGGDFMIPGVGQSGWLVGGSIGYVRSDLNFSASPDSATFEGVSLGLYGGYESGDWFVNGALSQTFLDVDDHNAAFNLDGPANSKAQTQGVHVEGGKRFALTDALHLEPLASLSWVRADFDDLDVSSPDNPTGSGNTVKFKASTSLRGALGLRLSYEQALRAVRLHYFLSDRVSNEFDGKAGVQIQSAGPDAVLSDTFDGTFNELAAGISISNASGNVSGLLGANGMFGSDYNSYGGSLGFRYQW